MTQGIEEKKSTGRNSFSESFRDFDETAKTLSTLSETLRGMEMRFLGGAAETFLEAVERLLLVVERLKELQDDEWLTAQEAADYVKATSKESFEKIPGVPKCYLSGRVPRYHRADLREWLRSRTSPPNSA